jgi:3-dehydrosphinganine reductase
VTRIAGAHAVVTGGSSGIGLATACRLARGGARVSLLARDPDRLDEAAKLVGGNDVAVAPVDVSDAAALSDAIARVCDRFGPCDVLLAAAGGAHAGHFEELDDVVFRAQLEIDYLGSVRAARAVVPSMRERRRGHLVFVSSTAALVGVFGYTAYAPAKAAVRSFAETLRPELAPYSVVVSCAYPPDTRTPGYDRENGLKPEETARISAAIKPRDPDQIARAIVRGIERDHLVITADFQTAALARAARLWDPYVRFTTDRTVRRVRRSRGTFGT